MPPFDGLVIGPASHQQVSSSVNGLSSTLEVYAFPVTPQRQGTYTIPALTVAVGGQNYSTAPLKLHVRAATAPSAEAVNSGNETAFFKLNFPKEKIYAGETAVARVELFLRNGVGVRGFQLTSSPTEGFSAGKLVELQNQQRNVQIGNHVFRVIPLAVPLTAVKTGKLTLGPITASAVLELPTQNQNQNQDPFFGQFFRSVEQKQVTLVTEAATIEALPLPTENKPANFSGAVGEFTLAATAGPTDITVGDPVTVRVVISGRGALDAVTLPEQDAWKNFKLFPPTAKVEPTDQFGFQGKKTFEQIISPLNSDVHELPPLTFSFFNPEDGQYHTLTQPAVPLTVKAAGATPLPTLAKKNSDGEEKFAPDILPVKNDLGTLVKNSGPLLTRPVFLITQSAPLLAFLAAFVWRQRADNLANNPRLRRKIAVEKLVQSGIADLKKFAAENKPEDFFALLFRLLQEQLGERLDCPASAITENVVEENPVLKNAPAAVRDGLREHFQLCNQARYAPVRGTAELNSVAAQFEKLVRQLQELKA
jgi:hypothetical protein